MVAKRGPLPTTKGRKVCVCVPNRPEIPKERWERG